MAISFGKVQAQGNLGQDAQTNTSPSGVFSARFSVAVNRKYNKADGTKVEETTWVPCVWFGSNAEKTSQWLKKGKQVYVEGRLQERSFVDKAGNDRKSLDVNVTELILGSDPEGTPRPNGGGAARRPAAAPVEDAFDFGEEAPSDDVPF